ncbi:MAG: lipase secretion chaperone [Spirochaetota bacterium]
MNKKVIIAGAAALAILSLVFLFTFLKDDETVENKEMTNSQNDPSNPNNTPYDPTTDHPPSFYAEKAEDVFGNETLLSYEEIMAKAKKGEINLVWELWAVRRKCPKEYRPQQCDLLIRGMLEKKYPAPQNKELLDLFDSYRKYEEQMRQFDKVAVDQKLKFKDKYEKIKQKRRELFGDEKAQLIFGLEESKISFANAQKTFLDENKNLSSKEKITKYEELKKKIYGDYYETIKKREQKYDVYQTELTLRQEELKKLDGKAKEKALQAVEKRIFGDEIAGKLAKNREDFAKQETQLADYAKQEKTFLSQNSGISDEDKKEKLRALRVKIFGEEGANTYEKRLELEEAMKNANKQKK